ncbi:hypothetical protein BZZ01_28935 [Nostocales cyanobacterium HT-58-2]|nr:hypothetical protein BZZ01_28935 [Nostocales cyanobacterium HT-58-2]
MAGSPSRIYYASASEILSQCSGKPLPLGQTQGHSVAPYLEQRIFPSECPGKRNKLNIEAFPSGKYPIMHNLFLVVKQIC